MAPVDGGLAAFRIGVHARGREDAERLAAALGADGLSAAVSEGGGDWVVGIHPPGRGARGVRETLSRVASWLAERGLESTTVDVGGRPPTIAARAR